MKKKHKKHQVEKPKAAVDYISYSTDFYSASPAERPLSQKTPGSASAQVRKTKRHEGVEGRGPAKTDPRERMALLAVLKAGVLVLSLMIAFFLLWKGIKIYEESVWLGHDITPEQSPVLQEVSLVGDFDIQDKGSREQFAERVELWKEADRLVRSADTLLKRKNYAQAMVQCQEALRCDPAHRGALERLGQLYHAQGDYVEAVNAYIRLLSVDPSKVEVQRRLIEVLSEFGDHKAVKYMARWYFEENVYDTDVQRYLADALYVLEEFEAAAEAYGRLQGDSSLNTHALERQVTAYMQVGEFEKALIPLNKLRELNYQDPVTHKKIAVCNAQLGRSKETVLALGRMRELFGEPMVLGLVKDPRLDPVREDRAFQAFVDRVGGEAFRLQMEALASQAEKGDRDRDETVPKLEIPVSEELQQNLLNRREN